MKYFKKTNALLVTVINDKISYKHSIIDKQVLENLKKLLLTCVKQIANIKETVKELKK